MPRLVWLDWQLRLLGQMYPIHSAEDISKVIGLSVNHVYRKARFLGLKKDPAYIEQLGTGLGLKLQNSGKAHRFQKGHVSWNKGISTPSHPNMVPTQFKKGSRPHTWVPIGSYRINVDLYLEYKFSDEPGSYRNRWIPVHRNIWIEANGDVPAGHVLRFKDGLKTNVLEEITLERLELITHAENLRRNSIYRLPPELQQVCRLRGILKRAITRKEKETS